MLVWAEYDPELFRTFSSTMVEAMCGDGSTMTCPTTLELADHNHLTEGASIGTVDESFSGPFSVWLAGLWCELLPPLSGCSARLASGPAGPRLRFITRRALASGTAGSS